MDWLEKARKEKEEAEKKKALDQKGLEKWLGLVAGAFHTLRLALTEPSKNARTPAIDRGSR